MSFKYLKTVFPAVYGLLIYACIRLVNDVISGEQFWTRDWRTNAIEIGCSIIFGYLFKGLVDYFLRASLKKVVFNSGSALKEFLSLILALELLVVITFFPLAAFTDDGLQWYDAINLSLIPVLFWLLHFSFARSINLLKKAHEQQVKIAQITSDKLQTELQFLKAQFHPHFLFNALNTIYFQVDKANTAAKFSIEKLSELLRYQLYDQSEKVPLSRELDYLQTYIALQRQRMEEDLNLSIQLQEEGDSTVQIYPLLLLPLVENAFKYVGGTGSIRIAMTIANNELRFEVCNSIPVLPEFEKQKAGIGLENLQRRLDLLYPNQYQLITAKDHDHFLAILKITI